MEILGQRYISRLAAIRWPYNIAGAQPSDTRKQVVRRTYTPHTQRVRMYLPGNFGLDLVLSVYQRE